LEVASSKETPQKRRFLTFPKKGFVSPKPNGKGKPRNPKGSNPQTLNPQIKVSQKEGTQKCLPNQPGFPTQPKFEEFFGPLTPEW